MEHLVTWICFCSILFIGADCAELVAKPSLVDAVKVWWDKGGLSKKDFIVYEPLRATAEWKVLGQRGQGNHGPLMKPILTFKEKSPGSALIKPFGFNMVWDDRRSMMDDDGSVWRLICPTDYVALGDMFYEGNNIDKPGEDMEVKASCVKRQLVEICETKSERIWDDAGSVASKDVSVWETLASSDALAGFFYAHNDHDFPPPIKFYCLKYSAYEMVN